MIEIGVRESPSREIRGDPGRSGEIRDSLATRFSAAEFEPRFGRELRPRCYTVNSNASGAASGDARTNHEVAVPHLPGGKAGAFRPRCNCRRARPTAVGSRAVNYCRIKTSPDF